MSKKYKFLLPFFLYENLENLDQLNPEEMESFLLSLRKYCDSVGKDYSKICQDLGIEEPEWSGKLKPKQIQALNEICKPRSSWDNIKKSWKLNSETGLVDIEGDIDLRRSGFFSSGENLGGIKFGICTGNFRAAGCGLTSLEGCPVEVTGDFIVSRNNIQNLKGGPIIVGGNYDVDDNVELKNLEGIPEEIGGYFTSKKCSSLETLEGARALKKVEAFYCSSTPIRNLKGAPEIITSTSPVFEAEDCMNLTSLEGAPLLVSKFRRGIYNFCFCSNLYSLEGLPLEGDYQVKLEKNGLKPSVLKNALEVAKKSKSWIVAYLSMFTDPDFIKTGKAPKDPIREKLAPDNIKKEIEENGERFVVGLKSIWNDFRVKKILREIEIPEDTKADADMLSALDDVGL